MLDGRGEVTVRPEEVIEPVRIMGSCTPGTISGTGTVDAPLAGALITGEEPDDRLEAGDAGARPGGARPGRALPALCAAPGQAGAAGHRVPLGRGPVWFGDHRTLVWSDIPNDRTLRWDAANEMLSVFRQPSNYANGNTLDQQGRLVTCEHGGRQVTRTEHDGTITVLADSYRGKRLNAWSSASGPGGSSWRAPRKPSVMTPNARRSGGACARRPRPCWPATPPGWPS